MSVELVQVGFHGDVVHAVKDGDGKVWVSLRRCCENLGIDLMGQLRKLKAKSWACVEEKSIHDTTGRVQPAIMLDLDSLPMWLSHIDPRKVKEQIREKLALYQRECRQVLADHFFGRTPPPQKLTQAEWLYKVAGEILEHDRRITRVEVGQGELEAEVREIRKRTGNLLDLIMCKVTGDGQKKVNPRFALEKILDSPELLELVYEVAPTHGGVDRSLERASGASPGLVHKVIREERNLVVRDGRLVAAPTPPPSLPGTSE